MGRPRVYPDELRARAVRLVCEWRKNEVSRGMACELLLVSWVSAGATAWGGAVSVEHAQLIGAVGMRLGHHPGPHSLSERRVGAGTSTGTLCGTRRR